jgi:hypothetical protein
MEKKQFLIPQILGILLAVSVLTACPELPVFQITEIDLRDVKPVDKETPQYLVEKGLYKVTLKWYECEQQDYKGKDFKKEMSLEKKDPFKEKMYYKTEFTIENKGCTFINPIIRFENFRELYIDNDKESKRSVFYKKDENIIYTTIAGHVIFSPLIFK